MSKFEVVYATKAREDREYWKQYNPKILKRLDQLIDDIIAHPFTGIGRPEPLRFHQSGYWSRRIDHEHRLVYKVTNHHIYIVQCRYHYEK